MGYDSSSFFYISISRRWNSFFRNLIVIFERPLVRISGQQALRLENLLLVG